MPELPEVETIKNDLAKSIINKRIKKVIVNNPKVIKEPSRAKFSLLFKNAKFTDVLRRGKLLVFGIKTKDNQKLFFVVHLRMTGQLVYGPLNEKSRVSLILSNSKVLNYNDPRLMGELRIRKDWQDLSFVRRLGPEPLTRDFKLKKFEADILRRKTKIKTLLLDQSFLAGLGNIYVVEALFHSKISPARIACSLTHNEIESLFKNIKKILKDAIKCRGSSVDDYRDGYGQKGTFVQKLKVYARKGKNCYKCKTKIERIVLAGRGTYYCPSCQV